MDAIITSLGCTTLIDNAHSTRQMLPRDLSCAIECALKRGQWLLAGGLQYYLIAKVSQPPPLNNTNDVMHTDD